MGGGADRRWDGVRGSPVQPRCCVSERGGGAAACRSVVAALLPFPRRLNLPPPPLPPQVVSDVSFYRVPVTREDIGEAVPIGADGTCAHPLLVPSSNRTLCVLPGRIDVARHFFTTGGVEGLKESLPTLSRRLLAFSQYLFNATEYPVFASLFADAPFQRMAKAVCPADAQVGEGAWGGGRTGDGIACFAVAYPPQPLALWLPRS